MSASYDAKILSFQKGKSLLQATSHVHSMEAPDYIDTHPHTAINFARIQRATKKGSSSQ